MNIVIVSGRSGSGKSSALDLLEDEGYTCIDNLPVSLLSDLLIQLRARENSKSSKIAIGIDARNIDGNLAQIPDVFEKGKQKSDQFLILYLDTSRAVLIKRFSETRRKHPLSNSDTGLHEAITKEDIILAPMAALADVTINTTHLSLHELRSAIKSKTVGSDSDGLAVMVTSFGFKFGVPIDADFVFDVRCLPNPYWEENLRNKSGKDTSVQEFLSGQETVMDMLCDIQDFVLRWIPHFERNNRSYLTIAIGCTGGMHRSVFLSEKIKQHLKKTNKNTQLRHRELERSVTQK